MPVMDAEKEKTTPSVEEIPPLQKPVFASEFFVKPIFNEDFSESLSNICQWFKTYCKIQPLTENIDNLVTEIIKINRQLLSKIEFDKAVSPNIIDMRLLTRWEFSSFTPNAKLNDIKDCTSNIFFTSYNNWIVIGKIYRKLQKMKFPDNEIETQKKINFLERFLGELVWAVD